MYKILTSSKLRHQQLHTYMYSVQEVRTRQSVEERDWSESSQIYYYSKFQLFDGNEDVTQFYQYSLFLEKISAELGDEWKQQASLLYSPHFNSKDIFMVLLSIWLHHHPVVNTISMEKENNYSPQTFNQNYLEDFNHRICEQAKIKAISNNQNFKIKKSAGKAICIGFFCTANEIWTEMFQKPPKKQSSRFNLFKGVTKKIQQGFQPLMVVTEKISKLFGRKKVKKNDDMEIYEQENGMFDCYQEFKKTVDLQKELVRKMSDFTLEEQDEVGDIKEKKKLVSQHEFKEDEAPVEKNAMGNFYQYVTKYLKTKYPWQVASSFVTNILDISQLQTDGSKIKILKPAEDFYQKLILVWLTLTKTKNVEAIKFEQYLGDVQCSFGESWKAKYVAPIKFFYEKLMKNWDEIMKETGEMKMNDEQMIAILIKKIRESMKAEWEKKIRVEKRKSQLKKEEV